MSQPAPPARSGRLRGPRLRLVVVALVALAALGLLAVSGLGDSLVYYRTPSELTEQGQPDGAVVRLGGMVAPNSVERREEGVRFVLTDGVAEVSVVHAGELRGVFQEGQGALVEGRLDEDGVFRSELLMVQHDNEYRAVGGDESYEPPSPDEVPLELDEARAGPAGPAGGPR